MAYKHQKQNSEKSPPGDRIWEALLIVAGEQLTECSWIQKLSGNFKHGGCYKIWNSILCNNI